MRIFKTMPMRRVCLALALAASAPLGGCTNVDRAVATSPVPDDYHLRHPVVLGNGRQTLDIFLGGSSGKLDTRQAHDVAAFAADYRQHGEGRILAVVPRGAVDPRIADGTLDAVRRILSDSGVRGEIEIGTYHAYDAAVAAPVHLSFVKLQAHLASHCGDWPDDLGPGQTLNSWENRTYYNLGCASQQTLTAQIDDPRDLVRPRADDPSDVQMRTRAIGDIRLGTDPSTTWTSAKPASISSVGAN